MLEDKIRELAARGDITHLSLVPTHDGKKFRARFAPSSVYGVSDAEDADPVRAIELALVGLKLKGRPKRAPRDRAPSDDDLLGPV